MAFTDLAGSPLPNPKSSTLYSYFKHHLIPARVAEVVDVDRSGGPTVYVDSSQSNDTGDGLTSGAAKKTIAAANDVIASLGNNGTLYVKKGLRYPSTEGIQLTNKTGWRITTYDAGAKPVIHCFNTTISSWTLDQGTTYYAAVSGEVGWVREATNFHTRMTPFRKQDSLANCRSDTSSRAFWYDSGNTRLYINYGADPGSTVFEYSLASVALQDGCLIDGGDSTLIENIDFEGWGACTNGNTLYGVRCANNNPNRVVIRDCEAYYCGSHAFGSVAGGILTMQRCKGGYCATQNASAGSTTYVFYSATLTSADEVLFDNCICRFGGLPQTTQAIPLYFQNSGIYAHNAGNSSTLGLFVAIDCEEPSEPLRTNYTATYGTTAIDALACPGDGTLDQCRVFWINHKVKRSTNILWSFKIKQVYSRCVFDFVLSPSNTGAFLYEGGTGGYLLKCIFAIDDYVTGSQQRIMFPAPASPANEFKFDGCMFYMHGHSSNTSLFNTFRLTSDVTQTQNLFAENCLFIRAGTKGFLNAAGNDSTHFRNCAGYNVELTGSGYSNSNYGFGSTLNWINLNAPISPYWTPSGTLAEDGAYDTDVEYDIFNQRSSRSKSCCMRSIY